MRSVDLSRTALILRFAYSLIGLFLGLVCILGGIALFLHGVTGTTSWTASLLGAESQIHDAAPGTILFVVGIFYVLITRFRFEQITTDKIVSGRDPPAEGPSLVKREFQCEGARA